MLRKTRLAYRVSGSSSTTSAESHSAGEVLEPLARSQQESPVREIRDAGLDVAGAGNQLRSNGASSDPTAEGSDFRFSHW